MKIGNTTLIPQNTAPENARKMVMFDSNGNQVCKIGLGHLAISNLGTKKYSVGLLSDTHTNTYSNAQDSYTELERAISWLSNNAEMTCIAGDLANLRYDHDGGLQKHKEIINANKGNMEVYEIPGNHEHWDYDAKVFPLADDEIKIYTGYPLYYTISNQPTDETERNYYSPVVGGDVYIMCGYVDRLQFNATTIRWL
jgi:predicted MPP superfamily phosphohydrolase